MPSHKSTDASPQIRAAIKIEKTAVSTAIRESGVASIPSECPNSVVYSGSITGRHKDEYRLKIVAEFDRHIAIP